MEDQIDKINNYLDATTVVYALNRRGNIFSSTFINSAISGRCDDRMTQEFSLTTLEPNGKFKISLEPSTQSLFAWDAISGHVYRFRMNNDNSLSLDRNYFGVNSNYGNVGTMFNQNCSGYKDHSFAIVGDPDRNTNIKNGSANAFLNYDNSCNNITGDLGYFQSDLTTDHKTNNPIGNRHGNNFGDLSSANTSFFEFNP